MPLSVTTTSSEGFASTGTIRSFTVDIDPAGEAAPDTLESLLAAYAACYMPALRVGAKQRDHGDLGEIVIEVTGTLNDDDKLEAVAFDISVDAEVTPEMAESIIGRANELCKVHAALRPEVRASVTFAGHPVG